MNSRSCRNRWTKLAALVAALLLADIALFALLPVEALYPSLPADPGKPLAIAAILFNGFGPGRTGVNDETARRLRYGQSLLQRNKVRLLLVVGGNRPDRGVKGARFMAEYLRSHGVAEQQIMVEDQSLDSLSNLERIRNTLNELDLDSAGLVSSAYHLLRIKALNSPAAEGFHLLPYPAGECDPPLPREELWLAAHGNLAAWLAAVLLPSSAYNRIVLWVRTHTDL